MSNLIVISQTWYVARAGGIFPRTESIWITCVGLVYFRISFDCGPASRVCDASPRGLPSYSQYMDGQRKRVLFGAVSPVVSNDFDTHAFCWPACVTITQSIALYD